MEDEKELTKEEKLEEDKKNPLDNKRILMFVT